MPKKNANIPVMLLTFLLVILLCGCSLFDSFTDMTGKSEKGAESEETETPPEIITDPNWPVTVCGTEIKSAPEKVACLSPNLCEYIYDMGISENLCAVPDGYCNDNREEPLPEIGSVIFPDTDNIIKLSPDYVIASSPLTEEDLVTLQQADITVIVFTQPVSLSELKSLYRELSIFFKGAENGSSYGNEYVSSYESMLDEITYKGEKKQAAILRNLDTLMVTGDGIAGELFSLSFENAAGNYIGYQYPVEGLDSFDPYVIFLGNSLHIIDLENSDLYRKKNAVKNDRIYTADPDVLSLGSKRSVQLLKDMMSTVYDDIGTGEKLEPAYPSKYKS